MENSEESDFYIPHYNEDNLERLRLICEPEVYKTIQKIGNYFDHTSYHKLLSLITISEGKAYPSYERYYLLESGETFYDNYSGLFYNKNSTKSCVFITGNSILFNIDPEKEEFCRKITSDNRLRIDVICSCIEGKDIWKRDLLIKALNKEYE